MISVRFAVQLLGRYRKLIAISEGDPSRDEARHQRLLRLLLPLVSINMMIEKRRQG